MEDVIYKIEHEVVTVFSQRSPKEPAILYQSGWSGPLLLPTQKPLPSARGMYQNCSSPCTAVGTPLCFCPSLFALKRSSGIFPAAQCWQCEDFWTSGARFLRAAGRNTEMFENALRFSDWRQLSASTEEAEQQPNHRRSTRYNHLDYTIQELCRRCQSFDFHWLERFIGYTHHDTDPNNLTKEFTWYCTHLASDILPSLIAADRNLWAPTKYGHESSHSDRQSLNLRFPQGFSYSSKILNKSWSWKLCQSILLLTSEGSTDTLPMNELPNLHHHSIWEE